MTVLATCAQMRSLDKEAIEKYGVPGVVLMENAARSVFEVCAGLKEYERKRAVIFCGMGNNGGDGFALARLMANDGADVKIVLAGDSAKITGDAKINYDICVNFHKATSRARKLARTSGGRCETSNPVACDGAARSGIEIIEMYPENTEQIRRLAAESPLVVDALLGTGVSGALRESFAESVRLINESGAFVIAIDCPTGGNPDNGSICGECVKAGLTVSLGLLKPGLLLYPLAEYVGKLEIGQIGMPKPILDGFDSGLYALDVLSSRELLPVRRARSHKGTYGKVALIAGSTGMAGVAAYCAKAAYAAGCGYVNACVPLGIVPLVQTLAPQAVITVLPEMDGRVCARSLDAALEAVNKSNVCLIGPGLGNTPETAEFVKSVIENAAVPLILDADALNAIAGSPEILKSAAHTPIVTPHPLEMSRLTGCKTGGILANTLEAARGFSSRYNAVTVLKDAATVISGGGKAYINPFACSALAKAGSGDVLAGIIAGLLAQGMEAAEAAALGVFMHSLTGIDAAEMYGERSVSSDGLIGSIGRVIAGLAEA